MKKQYQYLRKFIIYFILLLIFNCQSFGQTITPNVTNSAGKTFQTSSSGMDFNIGEPVTTLIANSNNQITQGFLQPEVVTLDLKVFIEGYYKPSTGKMRAVLYSTNQVQDSTASDYLTIQLRDPNHKDSIVDSFKAVLHTDGNAEFFFPYAIFNNSYYIVINHRNSTQTWSKDPVLFDVQLKSIDFTRN